MIEVRFDCEGAEESRRALWNPLCAVSLVFGRQQRKKRAVILPAFSDRVSGDFNCRSWKSSPVERLLLACSRSR